MSREPSSSEHVYRQALGRSGYREELPPPPRLDPLRKPQPPLRAKKKPPKIRVEGAGRDRAMSKWITTTTALSAYERKIIAGYRISVRDLAAQEARKKRFRRKGTRRR